MLTKRILQQHHIAELGKKQLEQSMQQLQEQIQVNLIQQTQMLQSSDKKKSSASLQQLAIQQQQLIQQLQIIQRQYVVQQGIGIQPIILAQAQVQAQGAGKENKNQDHLKLNQDAHSRMWPSMNQFLYVVLGFISTFYFGFNRKLLVNKIIFFCKKIYLLYNACRNIYLILISQC